MYKNEYDAILISLKREYKSLEEEFECVSSSVEDVLSKLRLKLIEIDMPEQETYVPLDSIGKTCNKQVIDLQNEVGELKVEIRNKKRVYSHAMKVLVCNRDMSDYLLGEFGSKKEYDVMMGMISVSSGCRETHYSNNESYEAMIDTFVESLKQT